MLGDDRVHFTNLKNMVDSPAHYLASVEEGFPDTPAFMLGRAVHYLTLGIPEGHGYVVYDGDRRGNDWKLIKELHEGKDIFKRSELLAAERMAAAVRADPVVQRLDLLEGEKERLIEWEYYGVPFSSRLDVLGTAKRGERRGRRHLVDLKKTTCAKPEKFHWDARRYHYPAQMATYEDAARYVELPVDDVYIIAVEDSAPYCVVVYKISAELREEGRRLTRGWIERYNLCKATGVWPGYAQDVVPMTVLAPAAEMDRTPLTLTMADGSQMTVNS